jgi:hypothetical protein
VLSFELVVVTVELVVVTVELVVVELPGSEVVVVPGSVGTVGKVTGTETMGTVVVRQPTTGRQSSGAAGALLVNAPARRMPAAKMTMPALTRAAAESLCLREVGGGEVMASLVFR